MPVNPAIRTLAQDGRISLSDAQKMKQAATAGTVSKSDVNDALGRYAEVIDDDAAALIADTFQGGARAKLSSLPEATTRKTLEKGMKSNDVSLLQRGLMSAGLSSSNQGMTLKSGADGIFGNETEASVRAFQKANGLTQTGTADPATLRALNATLKGTANQTRPATPTPAQAATPAQPGVRPSTGLRRAEGQIPAGPTRPATSTTPLLTGVVALATGAPSKTSAVKALATPLASPTKAITLPTGVKAGTADAVATAANALATGSRAANYGTVNPWKNIDPNHNAPVDVRMGGLTNRWKCNLFGGNALAAAGFEPPCYGNKTKAGEYALAEVWHQWSTPSPELKARAKAAGDTVVDYAKTGRNPSRFNLMDEVKPTKIADPVERQQRIAELLARVQPGDVVTVDHAGAAGSDGGHVRVCVGRDESGAPLFAQAKSDSARVVAEGNAENWESEDAIYILRPNTPRALPQS